MRCEQKFNIATRTYNKVECKESRTSNRGAQVHLSARASREPVGFWGTFPTLLQHVLLFRCLPSLVLEVSWIERCLLHSGSLDTQQNPLHLCSHVFCDAELVATTVRTLHPPVFKCVPTVGGSKYPVVRYLGFG